MTRVEAALEVERRHVALVQGNAGQALGGQREQLGVAVEPLDVEPAPKLGEVLAGPACDVEKRRGVGCALQDD